MRTGSRTIGVVVRLLASTGVILAGIASALVLHDHHFVATFQMTANGVPRSYRAATIPHWRDPLSVFIAFTAVAVGIWIAVRPRRVHLSLGVVGCAFAGAVYLHQQAIHTIVCPPGAWGCITAPPPGLWHHSTSLLVMAAGIVTAALLMIPSSIVAPKLLTGRA